MNENYIVINGKKIELTEEQLKQLGIEVRKNPFNRAHSAESYFISTSMGWSKGIMTQDSPMKRKHMTPSITSSMNSLHSK